MHSYCEWTVVALSWLRGATVARLTPDQKVACSNHVGVRFIFLLYFSSLIFLLHSCFEPQLIEHLYPSFCALHSVFRAISYPLHISRSNAPIGLRCSQRQIGTKPSDVVPGPHSHWLNGAQYVHSRRLVWWRSLIYYSSLWKTVALYMFGSWSAGGIGLY